jgi:hypothetical protein
VSSRSSPPSIVHILTTTRSFANEFCSCSISCRHPLVVGTPPAAGTWVESPSAESRRALDHSSRGTGTSPGRHPSTPSWVQDLLHRLACLGSICSPLSRFSMIVVAAVQSFAATGYNTWLLSHAL